MVQKKKKKRKAQLPFRLNILFFIVFLLFAVLILQLGVVQILNGEEFQEEIDKTIKDYTEIPVPRGKMYDRNHNLIVDNKPLYSITYTPAKGTQAKDRLNIARELAKYISMDSEEDLDGVTERNRKEYWYLEHTEEAKSRLTKEELEEMEPSEQYRTILERITEKEAAAGNFTKQELEVMAIKKEMDKAMTLTPQVIKNDNVTSKEFARVAEHLDVLKGINATTDWDREKPYDDTFSDILGTITSESQGILAEKKEYYLTRGYKRNDRVGRSGLEEQYENVLRGRKEKIRHTTNKDGKVIDSDVVVEGQRGKDLVLTIDMELQKKVNTILKEELQKIKAKYPYKNKYVDRGMAVVINPNTGELLSVAGQYLDPDDHKWKNSGFRALSEAHRPGSAIKGATVLAGYDSGVIHRGKTFYDAPINIKGTQEKSSYTNLGMIDDINALKRSSNVYMFYIAMRMGGDYNYVPHEKLDYDPAAFTEMRSYFSQFGLGVKTGVDFPYESTGYKGSNPQAGNLMDYAIGQYDTFTTLQLAQYVSTIANDGYRVKPHFLKEIRNPVPNEDRLGPVYQSENTEVLNRVTMDDKYLGYVQEGFRRAYQESGGTAAGVFAGKPYNPAGKTGTAENEIYEDGKKLADTENSTLVGYAPFDDPEVAFAIVVPNTRKYDGVNSKIGARILDTYFEVDKKEKK